MNLPELLQSLFPEGHTIENNDWMLHGEAQCGGKTVGVLGTYNHVSIGIREVTALSEQLLAFVAQHPGRPIVMLVDNEGQRMSLDEELLVLPEFIAHLLKVQQFARRQGCKLFAIVHGHSIAGGFIAFGMLADRVVSLPGAETSVMKLEAISRVTKMPLEKLEALAKQVSVFAPGCENFYKMGGLYECWTENYAGRLAQMLETDMSQDLRCELGLQRGGRTAARQVIEDVLHA